MRKSAFGLIFLILLITLQSPLVALAEVTYAPDEANDFQVMSASVYLYNLDAKTVVYQKDAQNPLQPASTAKIMTAILALENTTNLEEEFTYPNNIFTSLPSGVSHADVRPGEIMTMKKALYALMLQSDCFSALGIADKVGDGTGQGGVEAFVALMNQKAKELGAQNTVFMNPHGLYDEGMTTTAYDLALIAKYAMEVPEFMEIATMSTIDLAPTNKHAENYNLFTTIKPMVKSSPYYYEPIRGIKTGTLDEVGYNFVSSAQKDGYNYLLVLMGAPIYDEKGEKLPENYSFIDAKNIYEWAFSGFETKELMKKGDSKNSVPVRLSKDADTVNLVAAESFTALVPSFVDVENGGVVVTFRDKPEFIDAPVKRGQKVCTAEIRLENEILGTVDMLAEKDLSRSQVLYMMDWVKNLFSAWWLKLILVLVVLIVALYVTMVILRNRYRSKRRQARGRRKF